MKKIYLNTKLAQRIFVFKLISSHLIILPSIMYVLKYYCFQYEHFINMYPTVYVDTVDTLGTVDTVYVDAFTQVFILK